LKRKRRLERGGGDLEEGTWKSKRETSRKDLKRKEYMEEETWKRKRLCKRGRD